MARPSGIRWLAPGPGSGFGDAAQAYLAGLRRLGVPVTWTPMGWPSPDWDSPYGPVDERQDTAPRHGDVAGAAVAHDTAPHDTAPHDTVVVQGTPLWHPRLAVEAEGRRLVAFTAWETDRVGRADVAVLEHYDLVLVPSAASADTLVRSGVTVPVRAVPHIARVPAPGHRVPATGRTVFYTMGPWTSRKAVPDVVAAFLAAFTDADDVALVVHTTADDLVAWRRTGTWPPGPPGMAHDPRLTTWFALARVLAGRDRAPEITLSTRHLAPEEVDGLHARGDCFVSLSRGEGWGLCAFDAVAAGNPVVATGWGATAEFLPDGYPYLVDHDLVPTTDDEPDAWWTPDPQQRWARARLDHAARLLRRVADDRAEARSWGAVAGDHVRRRFGEATVTAQLLDALASAAPGTGRR